MLYGCPLFGGDTDRTPGPITISIAMFGTRAGGDHGAQRRRQSSAIASSSPARSAMPRSVSCCGKNRIETEASKPTQQRDHLLVRYLVPQPRNALAEAVRTHASAAMDVSDGLAGDFAKLCRASKLPPKSRPRACRCRRRRKPGDCGRSKLMETALTGGDDYEVVCTVPAAKADSFRAAARAANIAVTEIGEIKAGAGVRFVDSGGQALAFKRAAFSHF